MARASSTIGRFERAGAELLGRIGIDMFTNPGLADDELAEAIVDGMIDRSEKGGYALDRLILDCA